MKQRRKLFIEQVKGYAKKKKMMKKAKDISSVDASGFALIEVNLNQFEIYNPLSIPPNRTLNQDILTYIDEQSYPIPVDTPIQIRLYGDVDEQEQKEIIHRLQEYYDFRLKDKMADLKNNAIHSSVLFIIGILLFVLYFLLANFTVNQVWYEILSIIATFIVWEAADFFILERATLRLQYYEIAQLAICEKGFAKNKEKENKI